VPWIPNLSGSTTSSPNLSGFPPSYPLRVTDLRIRELSSIPDLQGFGRIFGDLNCNVYPKIVASHLNFLECS